MLNLWNESLWGDEGFSALAVMKSFPEMMGVVMRDTAPPGFYVLGWLWGRMFGFSEVALRGLSLLLILGAAIFGALIVYRLQKNKLLAGLAFLLCFLNPFSFPFAFEWRMYALLAFATLGSIYFFVSKKWWPFIILTTLAIYTHHFALFTVAGEGIVFLGEKIKECKKGRKFLWKKFVFSFWPFMVIGALYLPWLYPMYLQTKRVQGSGFWLGKPTWIEARNLMLRFMMIDNAGVWKQVARGLIVVLVVLKIFLKKIGEWVKILWLLMAPVVIAFGVSYVITPVFYDRYLLSVAVGMGVLWTLGARKISYGLLVILVGIYGFFAWQKFTHPQKRPFREVAAYVKSIQREGDFRLNYNGGAHHLWESKYYGIAAPIYVPQGELPLYVGTAQMGPEDQIKKIPAEAKRVIVLTSDSANQVELEEPWARGEVREFPNFRVILFEK